MPGALRAIHTAVQFLLSGRPSSTAQYYTGDPGYGATDTFDENTLAGAFLNRLDDGPFLNLRHWCPGVESSDARDLSRKMVGATIRVDGRP